MSADTLRSVADELLSHLQATRADVCVDSGCALEAFDDLSLEGAEREAAVCRRLLQRLDALPASDGDDLLLAQVMHHRLQVGTGATQDHWLRFVVTPYAGVHHLRQQQALLVAELGKAGAGSAASKALVQAFVKLLDQATAKTLAQAALGIRVPLPALPSVRNSLAGLRASAAPIAAGALLPAFDRLLGLLDDDDQRLAPQTVGLSHYPGGGEAYLRAIFRETGLRLTPQHIHERGLATLESLCAQMQNIRDSLGFAGSREDFHAALRADPALYAATPQALEARYRGHLARVEPHLQRCFHRLPTRGYDIRRASPAAEAAMAFGFYREPSRVEPTGCYFYNGSALDQRCLVTAAHLIHRELLPGHHLRVALEADRSDELSGRHPVRAYLGCGAFTQGWADYGSDLAAELGAFDDPHDRYGKLLMEAFAATRLVVDTGMNALGWPLAKGRQFMRDNTIEGDALIATESLRYATDLFGQALGYRLGHEQFRALRAQAQARLGPHWDPRRFHAALMDHGAMPLNVLQAHIEAFIAQELAEPGQGRATS